MLSVYLKMPLRQIKFLPLAIFLITIYLIIIYGFLEMWFLNKNKSAPTKSVTLRYVVVHIDLKGAAPKLTYLESLLPFLKDLGVNGLLMEYEDMFPYEGKLINLSAQYCFKKTELNHFVSSAVKSGFEIIPLVQTFGHMEHALKLKEFNHLREVPMYPDSICPNKIESKFLIKGMLKQVIKFHSEIAPLKYIHIGCDEVFNINRCGDCLRRKQTDMEIYINHVRSVIKSVNMLSPTTKVLIWDDMLRGVKLSDWFKLKYFDNVEPVYWDYTPNVQVSNINLFKYHRKMKNIWLASAFKGADGRTASEPNLINRFENHFQWMKVLVDYKFGGERNTYDFNGIILTGWSRYSHMDPLCEIFPASIPSLALNLLLIKRFINGINPDVFTMGSLDFLNKHLSNDFIKILNCKDNTNIYDYDHLDCTFKGIDLYNIIKQYTKLNYNISKEINDDTKGLHAIQYYSIRNNLNVNSILPNLNWCKENLFKLSKMERRMTELMCLYYNKETVEEYVQYKFYDIKQKLYKLLKHLKDADKFQTWHRRSFY